MTTTEFEVGQGKVHTTTHTVEEEEGEEDAAEIVFGKVTSVVSLFAIIINLPEMEMPHLVRRRRSLLLLMGHVIVSLPISQPLGLVINTTP